MKKMELIQFSTLTCPPCMWAKDFITRNFDVELINYTYIPVEYIQDFDPKYLNILTELGKGGVPLFVITEEDHILQTFRGFGPTAKEEITKYAEYVIKHTGMKIQENLPEELEQKLINVSELLLLDELENPEDFEDYTDDPEALFHNYNSNGHLDLDDLEDLDDDYSEDLEEDLDR